MGLTLISDFKKRSNVAFEIILIVSLLFVFAIVSMFTYSYFSNIMDDVTSDPDISATATAPAERFQVKYPTVFDTGYVIILVALWLGAIISAFQIDTYPIFIGISVFALIVVLIVPPILGNAYEETFADDTSSGLTDTFPAMYYIMTHILEISIFIGLSVIVALYAKSKMM